MIIEEDAGTAVQSGPRACDLAEEERMRF